MNVGLCSLSFLLALVIIDIATCFCSIPVPMAQWLSYWIMGWYILGSHLGTGSGARRSSVVRAFAHVAMGRRIDPSWGESIELFLVPASAPRLV